MDRLDRSDTNQRVCLIADQVMQLLHPITQSIAAAVEIHREETFDTAVIVSVNSRDPIRAIRPGT